MFLDAYHARNGETVSVSRDQASRFAKYIAGDFNPLHDHDARRFCVPGDLLFALVLNEYGLSASMTFRFDSMLDADTPVIMPPDAGNSLRLRDTAGECYLSVERAGPTTNNPATIEAFIRRYVAFSGYNFPHYLNPLMENEGVMFNPDRPFVIYDSMGFQLNRPDLANPTVALSHSSLDVQGRRGDAALDFALHDGGEPVGHGSKRLLISGLKPYNGERMASLVAAFNERRAAHLGVGGE